MIPDAKLDEWQRPYLAHDNPRLVTLPTAHSLAWRYRRWSRMFDQAAELAERSNPGHAEQLRARARDCRHAAACRSLVEHDDDAEQHTRIEAMNAIYRSAE